MSRFPVSRSRDEAIERGLSDDALLDLVQRRTLSYFWDFGHPASGMARDRSNPVSGYDYRATVTIGGTGFGIMAMIAGAERGLLPKGAVVERLQRIVDFLLAAETYHGAFPHFMHGETGETIAFSDLDDGADLVETSFLVMGLITARQYLATDGECHLGAQIDRLWHGVEWDWFTRGGRDVLFWHWSPRHDWAMNHEIRGWNECLMTYVLAQASPRHPIAADVYHRGWAGSPTFRNGNIYYDLDLPLGPPYGGPLFFSHYSFMGLDPRGLSDRYADYWLQNRNHTLINHAHCISNPHRHAGFSEHCWGLTASDGDAGYGAFCPDNDRGVIAPTAALSAMPYVPSLSIPTLRHFYEDLGDRIWGEFGFLDAFNQSADWVAEGNLAINQGPIVVMIENHRSGLLWELFMSAPEVRDALLRLGFESPRLSHAELPAPAVR